MKKINIVLVVLFLVINSCSSDDNETKVYANIIGTWIGTDLALSGELETEINGQTIFSTISGEGYDLTNKLIFNEEPNTVVSEGKLNIKITYTLNGIELTEDIEDFEFLGDGTWEINGSELIITDPNADIEEDETRIVNIFKLTDTELIIKITEKVEETEGNEIITGETEIIASFVRQ